MSGIELLKLAAQIHTPMADRMAHALCCVAFLLEMEMEMEPETMTVKELLKRMDG